VNMRARGKVMIHYEGTCWCNRALEYVAMMDEAQDWARDKVRVAIAPDGYSLRVMLGNDALKLSCDNDPDIVVEDVD